MTRQAIIERTIRTINELPDEKVQEVSDFADFVIRKYEEVLLAEGIQKMTANSQTFDFLTNEEEIYTEADLKVVYNG